MVSWVAGVPRAERRPGPCCREIGTLREARTGLTRPAPRGPLIYNFAPRAVQDKDKESREWIQVGQPAAMAFPAVAIH